MTFWEFANKLRRNGELCDVCFHVVNKQGEPKSIWAHKLILAYSSPYLSELIRAESVKDVTISQVKEETLVVILELLYHQKSTEDLLTLKNFQEVVQDLKFLQVDIKEDSLNVLVGSQLESTGIECIQKSSEADKETCSPKIEHSTRTVDMEDMTATFPDDLICSKEDVVTDLDSKLLSSQSVNLMTQACSIDTVPSSFLVSSPKQYEDLTGCNPEAELGLVMDPGHFNQSNKDHSSNSEVHISHSHMLSEDEQLVIGALATTGSESTVKQDELGFKKDSLESSEFTNSGDIELPQPIVHIKTEPVPETVGDIKADSVGKSCLTDNKNNIKVKVRLKRKKKKKEISMEVLRRFCAKQAEQKKQAASGSEGKSCEIESPSLNKASVGLALQLQNRNRHEGSVTCEHCGVVLPSYSLWERHVLTHTGDKSFECEICGKKYSLKGNLVVHQKSHGYRDKNFECSTCSGKFLSKGALKRHVQNIHTTMTQFKCEHCDSVFKSAHSLKTHVETKHEIKQLLTCEECEKTFTNPMYLKRHKLTHTDDLPFSCKHCSLTFRTYGARSTHISMVHTNEMFICDACGNSYHSKSALLAHKKRVHQDKDPSRECPICRKYVSNFYNHIRMHKSYEKGEVFSCPECGKTFPLKTYLQQHMYVHKKKRFSCTICKKEFTFNASLQSHLKHCIQRKARAPTSLFPVHMAQCEKQPTPLVPASSLNFRNIQSTIQQPFVFKYQCGNYSNILTKETPALEDVDISQEDQTEGDIGKLIAHEEGPDSAELELIKQAIGDTTSVEALTEATDTEPLTEVPVVLQDQLGRTEEQAQAMRSIRIQPGDCGKPILIEQTYGHTFSEDQLATIVSSLGVETLKGDVQYVCIVPE